METVSTKKAKDHALRQMKIQEVELAKKIDRMVETGELKMDDDGMVEGCGQRWFCGMFARRRTRVASSAPSEARAQTATEARLFGQRGKAADPSARLSTAAESVRAHAESLQERVEEARAKAQAAHAAGKKAEAMASLKRMKALEKQLATVNATHTALELQVDVLAESALQKEVASALSASVSSVKKRTKGLLQKTETAFDDAAELRDLSSDISDSISASQPDAYDEDELLAELNAMVTGDEQPAAPVVAQVHDPVGAATLAVIAEEDEEVRQKTLRLWPKAPTEKISLLNGVGSSSSEKV